MRIQALAISSVLALSFVAACDKKEDKKEDKKADKKDEPKAEEPKAEVPKEEPKPEAGAAVETSPEMTSFLAKFDGTDAMVTGALKEFGANDAIHGDDMGMYTLGKPKVISKDGDCYTFEAEAGITVRTYAVCWAAGKINKIEDKGMR